MLFLVRPVIVSHKHQFSEITFLKTNIILWNHVSIICNQAPVVNFVYS